MATNTSIEALEGYAAQLDAAAQKGNSAAEKLHQFVHGPNNGSVDTESGQVPTISKLAAEVLAYLVGLGSFKQDDLDAVVRSYVDKLRDFASVKDFGGVGDGVADDTEAFVKLARTGRSGLVPDGNWQVTITSQDQADAIKDLMSRLHVHGSLVVNYADGVFIHDTPYLYRVEGGQNLKIRGAAPIRVSITGQVSVSGSAGDYYITLTLNSIEGVSVGHWLHTDTTYGQGHHYAHRGVWPIVAIDSENSRVVVRNTHRKPSFPTNAISASDSGVVRTNLHFRNCDGFVVPDSNLGEVSALVASGNSDEYWSSANVVGTEKGTHGAVIGSQTISSNGKPDNANPIGVSGGHMSAGRYFGVFGFDQQGVVCECGGTFWGDFAASCNNKRRGFYFSTGSAGRLKHISTAGNYLDGMITDLGGSCYSSSSGYSGGNGGAAISATQSGMISFDDGIMANNVGGAANIVENGVAQFVRALITDNGSSGVIAAYGSTVYCDNAKILNSNGYGIDASFNSSVRAIGCTVNGSTLFGLRATENSFINHTNADLSGNALGPFTNRAGGLLLDGSTYREGTAYNSEYRAVNISTLCGARFNSTSGGDDFIIGHDTVGSGTYAPKWHFRSGTGGGYTESDNDTTWGRPQNRFAGIHLGSSPSVTSDGELKDLISNVPDEILDAYEKVLYQRFKYKDAIERKKLEGKEARWHTGLIAQQIVEVFAEGGQDAFEYGLVGFDSWEAKEAVFDDRGNMISPAQEAGGRHNVRYEEAQVLEALVARRERIKSNKRIADLEYLLQETIARVAAIESAQVEGE